MDKKRLKIALHETGHAVMALMCRQSVHTLSLREMASPNGTDNYKAFVKLESPDSQKLTGEKAIQRIMISLAGYASEILFYEVANIGGDDLTVAANTTEGLLQVEEFRTWVAGLPVPEPGALDIVTNPLVRAYIHHKMGECIQALGRVKPAIQFVAEELIRKEELSGAEVSAMLGSWQQSSL